MEKIRVLVVFVFLLLIVPNVFVKSQPVIPPEPTPGDDSDRSQYFILSKNKPTFVSSEYSSDYAAVFATDDKYTTLWGSDTKSDFQWLYVDLEKSMEFNVILMHWYNQFYAREYQLAISEDGINWQFVYNGFNNGNEYDSYHKPLRARYVGILMKKRNAAAYGLVAFNVILVVGSVTPEPTATPVWTPTPAPNGILKK